MKSGGGSHAARFEGEKTMKEFDVPLVYPPEETVQKLVSVFRSNPEQFQAASIRPPAAQLQELSGLLDGLSFDLINPPLGFAQAFNGDHAPPHLLADSSPVFQLVSFNPGYSREAGLDDLLRAPKDWGKRALAIGGLVDYGLAGRGYFTGQPGVLAVMLRYDGAGLAFELWSDKGAVRPGTAVLLERQDEAPGPYTFFLPDRLCFSQFQMQARLAVAVPVDELARSAAEAGTRALIAAGLLPGGADAEFVNLDSARASVLGAIDESQVLSPDLIVAAAVPFAEQSDGGLDVTFGDAVLRVTRPIAGLAARHDGEPAAIGAGDYRLDVLELGQGLVGQLVSGRSAEYFIPLRVGQLEGDPYQSEAQDDSAAGGGPLVAVDSVCLFSYCTGTPPLNPVPCIQGGVAVAGRWRVSVCFG
jgi:hypothetical protein